MSKKLNYLAGFFIVAFVVLFIANSDSNKDIKNYPVSGANIVAFGDSLVEGVGASPGSDFVSVLSRKLDVQIENLGKSGDTTAKGLARIDDVLKSNPDIVLILLGGNDYLRRISKKETIDNLGKMIELVQSSGAIVVLLGVRGGVLRDNYASDFEELSVQYKTAYVSNVLDGLIGNPDLMSDSIHPNDEGYEIIAGRVYNVINDLMN